MTTRVEHDHLAVLPPELTAAELLVAIIKGSQDAIVASDLDGVILSWNPAATAMFGYEAHEVIGQNMYGMVPIDAERLQHDVFCEVYAGRRVEHYETQLLTKDGSVSAVSLNVSPLIDQRGVAAGACTIVRDISERIGIETERERIRISLDVSHQAMVHDLKGPLGMTGAMIADAQLALGQDDSPCARLLAVAGGCIDQMKMLVDDVVLLHRIYDPDERGTLDVASLIRQAAESVPGVDVQVGAMPELVVAHQRALLRLVRNLLENAVRYAADHTGTAHMQIHGATTATHWQLVFEDHGPGISDTDLERVFDPFYRGADRSNIDGTGLGLAIVHACAKAHGGQATARNLDAGGLSICVTIAKPDGGVDGTSR